MPAGRRLLRRASTACDAGHVSAAASPAQAAARCVFLLLLLSGIDAARDQQLRCSSAQNRELLQTEEKRYLTRVGAVALARARTTTWRRSRRELEQLGGEPPRRPGAADGRGAPAPEPGSGPILAALHRAAIRTCSPCAFSTSTGAGPRLAPRRPRRRARRARSTRPSTRRGAAQAPVYRFAVTPQHQRAGRGARGAGRRDELGRGRRWSSRRSSACG